MAFGGTQANTVPNTATGARNQVVSVTGLTLAARIGAPDPTAADTGVLVTGTAAANQNALPATFGPTAGTWTQADVDNLWVEIDDSDDTADATASQLNVASRSLSSGNLVLTIHNRGAGVATGATQVRINLCIPQ